MPITISFITANYVARARRYSGENDWGVHDRATVEQSRADPFDAVARDVQAAGFDAVDVWMAHCHWRSHDAARLRHVRESCGKHGLRITSYAGGLHANTPADLEQPLRFMGELGAPVLAGGLWGGMAPADVCKAVQAVGDKYNVSWGLENHPEKSVDEILAKIGGGQYPRVGVALDTGWCITQQFDALDAVRRVADRGKLMLLHLKDVTRLGGHDTCAIGDGVLPAEQIVRHLKRTGWTGTICIEHEPYDRDPMPEVKTSLARVREWLS